MQQMWKFVGIIVFSIAFGMVLTLLISNRLAGLIVAVILLLVSYNMIFCENRVKAVSGNTAQTYRP